MKKVDLGSYDETIKCYRKMLELNPSYSETYYNIGCVYKDMGERDLEIVEYQKCLQVNPSHAKCYNNTGVVMNEIKLNYPEALKNFELAV